jgi:hypothetical protein
MQHAALLQRVVRHVVVGEIADDVARQDRIAVVPVRVHRIHAVAAVLVAAGGEELQLRAGVIVGVARQPLVAVLHFLQEHDVGVDAVERQPHLVDARQAADAGHALVDVVGGDLEFHDASLLIESGRHGAQSCARSGPQPAAAFAAFGVQSASSK